MAFDKHNVVDTMNEEETARFGGLRNQVGYWNNLGGALALISRGTKRWIELLEEQDYSAFYRFSDLLIFTKSIGRDPDRHGPGSIWRYQGMDLNMVCIDGDKETWPNYWGCR